MLIGTIIGRPPVEEGVPNVEWGVYLLTKEHKTPCAENKMCGGTHKSYSLGATSLGKAMRRTAQRNGLPFSGGYTPTWVSRGRKARAAHELAELVGPIIGLLKDGGEIDFECEEVQSLIVAYNNYSNPYVKPIDTEELVAV